MDDKPRNDLRGVIAKVGDFANMEVPEVVENTVRATVEYLTMMIASKPSDMLVSLGNVAQRIIAGEKVDSLRIELEELRKKGRVKTGYYTCKQAKYTLLELLKFLDGDEVPDDERFQVLKKILLVAASEELSDRDSMKPQQFMQIVKGLSSGAVTMLFAVYELSKDPPMHDSQGGGADDGEWTRLVAEKSGLEYHELVGMYEKILMDKQLLTGRLYRDGSGIRLGAHFRLTGLGYELCRYIDHYGEFGLGEG